MSSSSSSPSPLSLIARAEGKSLTQIAKQGAGGFLLAVSVAFITGLQDVFNFLILPFRLFIDVAEGSVQAFFLDPFSLVPEGVRVSARHLAAFEFLGLPVAVGIVLLTLLLVMGFIAISITSNVLPGLVVDNPLWDFFFGTPEEEAEGED